MAELYSARHPRNYTLKFRSGCLIDKFHSHMQNKRFLQIEKHPKLFSFCCTCFICVCVCVLLNLIIPHTWLTLNKSVKGLAISYDLGFQLFIIIISIIIITHKFLLFCQIRKFNKYTTKRIVLCGADCKREQQFNCSACPISERMF